MPNAVAHLCLCIVQLSSSIRSSLRVYIIDTLCSNNNNNNLSKMTISVRVWVCVVSAWQQQQFNAVQRMGLRFAFFFLLRSFQPHTSYIECHTYNIIVCVDGRMKTYPIAEHYPANRIILLQLCACQMNERRRKKNVFSIVDWEKHRESIFFLLSKVHCVSFGLFSFPVDVKKVNAPYQFH